MQGWLSTATWVRTSIVVGAYVSLWIAWRAGMEVLHTGFTYLVMLLATVVCGALVRHWAVVLLGLVPVLVFMGQGAPEGVSAPSELMDFFTPVVASCAVVGAALARQLQREKDRRRTTRPPGTAAPIAGRSPRA